MDAARVDPEVRAARRRHLDLPVDRRWARALVRFGARFLPPVATPGVTLDRVRDGSVRARVHRPDTPRSRAALLWIHGGGLVLGAAVMDDRFCGEVAKRLGITVVAAEYRLAPEHPYPAAHDDLLATWEWMRSHAETLDFDPDRVAIGGGSAGGGLAASLALRLHDRGGAQPAAQLLVAPMLDDRTADRRELDQVDHWVWNNRSNRAGWAAYLGSAAGGDDVHEYAAPARRADLSGLPPAWIGVGDLDLFLDEDVDYARRLVAAGVDTTLDVTPNAPHGFEGWAPDAAISRDFRQRAQDWLMKVL
ncbi:alpha/beta hydrolase [Microbacterium sp.]|uniref:alpha/beta hydrolase n=1 Tax=Microbacterium sp. TaxID=51671 RepID=UPI002811D146|nr:alpha/beta hydrolase [Microbacterium sp.]